MERVAHYQYRWYCLAMARTNMDGQPIRRVLSWLTKKDLTDGDLAEALGVPASNYSRHKDDDDFPSFEDLNTFGRVFGISPRVLQIAFGLRGMDEIIILNEEEMWQFIEQGGGNHLHPPMGIAGRKGGKNVKIRELQPRPDRSAL